MKLKKGSAEAKRYMAKIRSMKAGSKKKATKKKATNKKTIGATMLIEANESKKKRPTKVIKITRESNGTFKNFKALSGVDYLNEINYCLNKIDKHNKFIEMNAYKLKNKTMNKETKDLLKKQIILAKKYIISDKKRINELKKLI